MSMIIQIRSKLDKIIQAYEKYIQLVMSNCFTEIEQYGQHLLSANNEIYNLRSQNSNLLETIQDNNNKIQIFELNLFQSNNFLTEIGVEMTLSDENNNYINIIKRIREMKDELSKLYTIIHQEKEHVKSQNNIINNLKSEISILNEEFVSAKIKHESCEEHVRKLQNDILDIKKCTKDEKDQIIINGKKIINKYRKIAIELITIISANTTEKSENKIPIFEIHDQENLNPELIAIEDEWLTLRTMIQHQTNIVKTIDNYKEAAQKLEANNTMLALKYKDEIETLKTEVNNLKDTKSLAIVKVNDEFNNPAETLSNMIKTLENINQTLIKKYPKLYNIISLRNMYCVRGEQIPEDLFNEFFSSIGINITNFDQMTAIKKFFETPLKTIEITI